MHTPSISWDAATSQSKSWPQKTKQNKECSHCKDFWLARLISLEEEEEDKKNTKVKDQKEEEEEGCWWWWN